MWKQFFERKPLQDIILVMLSWTKHMFNIFYLKCFHLFQVHFFRIKCWFIQDVMKHNYNCGSFCNFAQFCLMFKDMDMNMLFLEHLVHMCVFIFVSMSVCVYVFACMRKFEFSSKVHLTFKWICVRVSFMYLCVNLCVHFRSQAAGGRYLHLTRAF